MSKIACASYLLIPLLSFRISQAILCQGCLQSVQPFFLKTILVELSWRLGTLSDSKLKLTAVEDACPAFDLASFDGGHSELNLQ